MKLKTLIKKFSYNELVKTCQKEGWKIPSSKDVEGKVLDHETFWISDLPEKQDRTTHAHIFNQRWQHSLQIANKHFLMNAVVIVEEKFCENCKYSTPDTTYPNSVWCMAVNIGADFADSVNADFGCNKFERKENK